MGRGWFESEEDYQARVTQEGYESTIERLTGDAPKQGWLESSDDYSSRIRDEASKATIEDATGTSPSQGWFENDSDYRDRLVQEAQEATIERNSGDTPNQGWFESSEDYASRIRHEAYSSEIEAETGEKPRQGFFEGDSDFHGRVSLEAREARVSSKYESETFKASSSTTGGDSGFGGLLILALIIAGAIYLFSELENTRRTSSVPAPPQRVALSAEQALENPALLQGIPSVEMTFTEYALAHSLTRHSPAQILYAPGQPEIDWNVPIYSGPTTVSPSMGELSFGEQVSSEGTVQGSDGRTWEVVTRSTREKGFVLQEHLRARPDETQRQAERRLAPPEPIREYSDNLYAPFCSGDYEIATREERDIACSDTEALRLQHRLVEVLRERVEVEEDARRPFRLLSASSSSIAMCGAFHSGNIRGCVIRNLRDLVRSHESLLAESRQAS